ncbi:hypothetical protein DE4585_04091 [Mycobacteroides salmoniphilum]|uniref:Uncharacterized protein n=1 Tax=Mycobacteroides salmoniphilum TaxID=404941 RepID=A0A4V3HXQ6_9MYCO|nr:endonuclease [Mycobacteroides salmoniphilum]TDZ78254.1 hypothetical protein DE4585_04091 [Mycobacteroides salmoniphilum]
MSLSLADIKRADVQSFRDVAAGLDKMATANINMKSGVGRLPIAGDAWKGVSGDAAHHELDGFGKLLGSGAESQKSAAAKIRRAADEFEGVKQLLAKIEQDAAKGKFKIDPATGKVTPPNGDYDKNELNYIETTLRQIMQAGDAANADLAAAVKAAKELPDPSSSAAAALPVMPNSSTKPDGSFGALQNLATAKPDGQPAETQAAAAGADTQANYKEWYPKAPTTGDKISIDPTKAGSFTGTVGALEKLPGTPKPPDGFGTGVARQFGQGVNQAIDGMIDEAKSKVGLNGADKFKEAWVGTAKGLENETIKQLFPGIGMAQDAKNMIDQGMTSYQHPDTIPKNIGAGLAQGAAIAATGPLAGEAAAGARGLIGDASIAGRGGFLDPPALPHDAPPAAGHGPIEVPSGPTNPGPVVDHPAPTVDHPTPTGEGHSAPSIGDHSAPVTADHNWDFAVDSNGHYVPGSLPSYEQLRGLTQTDPNTAHFWSGRDASGIGVGPDGSGIAERIADGSGGGTLETTLVKNGVDPLPVWNRHDPVSVQFWEDASRAYAENTNGEVTAVIGSDLRPGNIWQNVEIPRLIENPGVAKIEQIDPDTGKSTIIFSRDK